LYFDKILSGNRNISCSTCHTPLAVTGDGLPLSLGQGGTGIATSRSAPLDDDGQPLLIPRNAPEVFNRGAFKTMFWDARVTDLEDGTFMSPAEDQLPGGLDSALAVQAMFPVTSPDEMRGRPGDNEIADLADDDFAGIWSALMERLIAIDGYRRLFADAFPETEQGALDFSHAARAIAAFEIDHWTLDDSPFDNYLRGDDSALPEAAKQGALLFYGKAGCGECHAGSLMTDERSHNRCAPQLGPGKGNGVDGSADFGRENVTGEEEDRYKFRTPPLRNVAATGPWMHSGAFTSLEAVVRHELDPAGSAMAYDATQLPTIFADVYHADQMPAIVASVDSDDVTAISLTDDEVSDLLAFLESLTSPTLVNLARQDTPESVPSGLPLAD
ncbi:MAG: cytochrome-c peroxidase, partial [Planctomycetota bacterium]|jgi:cytochrome c peroxidase